MMQMPIKQRVHNYISDDIIPWINLHFPADSSYNGRVFIGQRKRNTSWLSDLTRREIHELAEFIPEMHISRRLDYYIMANTVKGVERKTEDVFSLNNIVIDIDCHDENTEMSSPELVQAFIWRCKRDLWSSGEMPMPNSVVQTGRGIQLWWAIKPISIKLEWLYRRIQNWLMDKLQEVLDEYETSLQGLTLDRAASQKLVGWFRMPLTYNTVAKRWGSLQILKFEPYNHNDLYEMVPKSYKTAVADRKYKQDAEVSPAFYPLTDGDIEALKDGSTAMALRVLKIVRLRLFRNASVGSEMRDLFCFVVYNALLAEYDEAEAWRRLQAFNTGFKKPLSERELETNMSSAKRKYGYKLTNQWIIDALAITEEEQQHIDLYPVTDKFINFVKPNSVRDQMRAYLREDRDNKVVALFMDGVSKAEIARTVGISRTTVIKIINDYLADCPPEIEETEAELPVAVGAENLSASGNNKLFKNGAIKYVSYVGLAPKEPIVSEGARPFPYTQPPPAEPSGGGG